MKILTLYGDSGKGKTTTLNIVYDMLIKTGVVPGIKTQLGANSNDFSVIVTYKGQQVAFYTMGDYSGALIEAIRYYSGLKVDTLICACNNKLVKPPKEIAKYSGPPLFLKTLATNHVARLTANTADANTIFAAI
ncbi:hypothetical protein [Pedobacter punctiformis]|uniref:Molybdopterin-guanine dinucleotide biosynthesis protein B n=1 Tax=Pedobacter punctiformis TaxID=3004097 RepID=A0ABT4L7E5_9SPHI|nr:hypothetical protein [Pedobacter sp. HCMS5-2]MCZ4243837.1 hypothetical protein [Pedobacter sp. HCMS5-2]